MRSIPPARRLALVIAIALSLAGTTRSSALTFNFINGGGVPADSMTAAAAAGNLWSGYFNDPITINVQITYSNLGTDVARSTVSSLNIATLSYDLIGVLAHELGHVLGFQSTAEIRSVSGGVISESIAKPQVADLFRFSQESTGAVGTFTGSGATTGVFDIAADNRPKYLSVDGGATSVAEFARGSSSVISTFGNGQQANHWLISATPIGIMDPTIGLGELITFTGTDLRFFDVLGFNPVPEPGTWAAEILLLLGGALLRLRKHAP